MLRDQTGAAMDYQDWIGRSETTDDCITLRQVAQMAGLLDRPFALANGDALPLLWHWMAFQPIAPMSELGPDGHPARGGFLPPVALERRMWAGGRVSFHQPLRIGTAMTRRSEIVKITAKTGAAGPMVFVTIRHDIVQAGIACLTEEQDLVFVAISEHFTPPAPLPVPPDPEWREDQPMDAIRLFRFSAVTFNGHRIHYDLQYAQNIEHYPGLVVHGPYQALLLVAAAQRHRGGITPARFSYRGVRPAFHFEPLQIVGLAAEAGLQRLCTANPDNLQCMQAEVAW